MLAFRRTWEGETVLAAANVGEEPETLPLTRPARDILTGKIFPAPGARHM